MGRPAEEFLLAIFSSDHRTLLVSRIVPLGYLLHLSDVGNYVILGYMPRPVGGR
jgi:hypothetical protein